MNKSYMLCFSFIVCNYFIRKMHIRPLASDMLTHALSAVFVLYWEEITLLLLSNHYWEITNNIKLGQVVHTCSLIPKLPKRMADPGVQGEGGVATESKGVF